MWELQYQQLGDLWVPGRIRVGAVGGGGLESRVIAGQPFWSVGRRKGLAGVMHAD